MSGYCKHGNPAIACIECQREWQTEQARGMMNANRRNDPLREDPPPRSVIYECPECGKDIRYGHPDTCKFYERVVSAAEVGVGYAIKHDSAKVRVELLPFPALEAAARVFTYGAKKYADHNYRKGMQWSRLLGAALRHLFAWGRGENIDPESGEPHLAHAACCVLMLLDAEVQSLGTDDRWRKG